MGDPEDYYDDFDDNDCANCGGEGFVYGCSWDWQCDTYDEEGRVTECPYNHPRGTRCPNCSEWPFKKGGAAAFISAVRQFIQEKNND